MLWCEKCETNRKTETDPNTGSICCSVCAQVIVRDTYSDDRNFVKGAAGDILTDSSLVKSVGIDYYSQSLHRAFRLINELALKLGISDAFAVQQARKFYQIAGERNFTRGRETIKVAAACLYIACRANKIPFLLVDFSIELCMNVYELGIVYLQLCKVLSLEMHSFVQKLVDPSLFIHRYTSALLKCRNMKVSLAALRIIVSMKRDWMQTGRKPSGLCGAAVYIAAIAHGFSCQKSDIVKVVHVCEATLRKRFIEFGNTESASLTIEEFNRNAKEFEEENGLEPPKSEGISEVFCQHKDETPYRHGLCIMCYKEFVEICGGLCGGSDPPAFNRAKTKKIIEESKNGRWQWLKKFGSDSGAFIDVSDSLSDVDDVEVDGYIVRGQEYEWKKVIWEGMNQKNIREQAAKKAAEKAGEAKRKAKKNPKQNGAKKASVTPTAAEAARQALSKKRLSSKVNFEALDKLFEDDASPSIKKNHIGSYHETSASEQGEENEAYELGKEVDCNGEELAYEYDQEGEDIGFNDAEEAYGHQCYSENREESYDKNYEDYDGYDLL